MWDKLQPQLVGDKTVLLSPDGATARFPWPALPGQQPGTYLIEDIAVAVVPIPRLLPELLASADSSTAVQIRRRSLTTAAGRCRFRRDPGKPSPQMLAQADPHAVRSGDLQRWPPLPATRTEMAAIADSFEEQYPDAKLGKLRGDKATKGSVAERLGNYRYVHLATHGFFAPPKLKSASSSNPAPRKPATMTWSRGRTSPATSRVCYPDWYWPAQINRPRMATTTEFSPPSRYRSLI